MPLTPSFGDRRVGPVVRLYRRVERALLEALAKAFPVAGHGWVWAQRAYAWLSRFRTRTTRILSDADRQMPPLVADALTGAWHDGVNAARADLPGPAPTADTSAVSRLIDDTVAAIQSTHRHVPTAMDNIYRQVINDAVRGQPTGSDADRRRVVQRALDQFARRGITGFVDRRGRRYDLVSYVELAVRSAITRAEVDGYCSQLTAAGHDLFIVSDVVGSCPLCAPFEGQVISITGATVGAIARDSSSGRSVTVTVMSSLDEARERGLFHRGCRHTIRVWTPDDPAPPRAVRVTDEVRAARRRQRALARRDRARQRVRYVAQSE